MARTPAKRAKKSAPVKRAARVERVPSEIEKLLKSLEDKIGEHPALAEAILKLENALSILTVKTGGLL